MTQIIEHTLRIATVTPSGRIDAFNAPDLRQELHQLLDAGVIRLVIDLTDVTFCDSAAMAVFVSAFKRARQAGGDVRLVWSKAETARRIFTLTKFDRVFAMHEAADAARQSFGVANG